MLTLFLLISQFIIIQRFLFIILGILHESREGSTWLWFIAVSLRFTELVLNKCLLSGFMNEGWRLSGQC